MQTSQSRLLAVQQRIASVAKNPVQLIAVSKTFSAHAVLALAGAGQQLFGENYVQEGVEKINQCKAESKLALIWHFIGPLQSNKTNLVAQHFDWVQTVDRLKIAKRLNDQRPTQLGPLQVCIQVNISAEPTKSGCNPSEVGELASAIDLLPNLRLRGLMAIPEPVTTLESRAITAHETDATSRNLKANSLQIQYDTMRQLFVGLQQNQTLRNAKVDTLSMGMSTDLEAAITAGSTMVRIGTALFGAR
jgi:PLP dependent protein